MTDRFRKVFIDSNMLIFAADFRHANVFEWMNQLYSKIFVHEEVYRELLSSDVKKIVNQQIKDGRWKLFSPDDSHCLSVEERLIYQQRLEDVAMAFKKMNRYRELAGQPPKTVSNLGEIATIAACLMIGAGIICSNDFDIRAVVAQENYRIVLDNKDTLLLQDSAEDFCVYCYQISIAARKEIRKFYKTVISDANDRLEKLARLDDRLKEVEE